MTAPPGWLPSPVAVPSLATFSTVAACFAPWEPRAPRRTREQRPPLFEWRCAKYPAPAVKNGSQGPVRCEERCVGVDGGTPWNCYESGSHLGRQAMRDDDAAGCA
ncbi:hypothetical protein GCM10010273_25080 [Streptomyces lavendulocolor]